MKLLSVICPVYNSKFHLKSLFKCIESQKFKNFEIIFIDDGSADDSFRILKDFKDKNSTLNVYLIKQKNMGPSAARNRGLERAKGKYCLFIDSDDLFENNFFEEMIKKIEKNKSELAICNFDVLNENFTQKYKIKLHKERAIFDSISLWNKIFKRDVIINKKIRFNESMTQEEDMFFLYQYMFYIDKISTTDKILYHYIDKKSSGLSKRFNPSFINCILIDSKLKELYASSPMLNKIEIKLYRRNIARLVWLLRDRDLIQRMDFYEKIKNNLNINYNNIDQNPFFSLVDKFSTKIICQKIFYSNRLLNYIIVFLLYDLELFSKISGLYRRVTDF